MKNRELQKINQKNWYLENKQSLIDKQRIKRNEIRSWFRAEILSKAKCLKCGENHPAAMDFHHRVPSEKEAPLGEMIAKKYSREKILAEIAKCDVLCANCHRIHHWEERNKVDLEA